MAPLSPHPEETRKLDETQIYLVFRQMICIKSFYSCVFVVHIYTQCPLRPFLLEVTHVPVDSHSHLYEDVRFAGLYQDVRPSPPSLFDHEQRNVWGQPSFPQVSELDVISQSMNINWIIYSYIDIDVDVDVDIDK